MIETISEGSYSRYICVESHRVPPVLCSPTALGYNQVLRSKVSAGLQPRRTGLQQTLKWP